MPPRPERRRPNPDPIDVRSSVSCDGDVELSAGLERRTAGILMLAPIDEDDLSPACRRNLARLRDDVDDARLGVMVVSNVRVEPWARGRGVGVALYLEAARLARSRFRAAIVSHACVGGQTSVEAARVWDSSRFRYRAAVRGQVAVWPEAPVANPAKKQRPARRPKRTRKGSP